MKREKLCREMNCPTLEKPENVVGAQATLFGETIFTKEHVDNNLLPRLLAFAERMWRRADWEGRSSGAGDKILNDFTLYVSSRRPWYASHIHSS